MYLYIMEKGVTAKDFEFLSDVNEKTYIIAPNDLNVPIQVAALIAKTGNVSVELVDKTDEITISLLIGNLVAGVNDDVVIAGNSKICEKLVDRIVNGAHLTKAGVAKKRKPTEKKPVEKSKPSEKTKAAEKSKTPAPVKKVVEVVKETKETIAKQMEEAPKKKGRGPASKNTMLAKAGIPKEHIELVLAAVVDSSDPKIGLPLQLQMKLAGVGAMDKAEKYQEMILPIYNKLRA